jgi:hypothetical protein
MAGLSSQEPIVGQQWQTKDRKTGFKLVISITTQEFPIVTILDIQVGDPRTITSNGETLPFLKNKHKEEKRRNDSDLNQLFYLLLSIKFIY